MTDPLDAFTDLEEVVRSSPTAHTELDILVIEQGKALVGILASAVDSVVPWQRPEPLPQASMHVLGIVQDRGRLVTVHRAAGVDGAPRRLAVCTTSLGLIGIAVTDTRHIGAVTFEGVVRTDVPIRTSAGALTLIDPEALARRMTESHGSTP